MYTLNPTTINRIDSIVLSLSMFSHCLVLYESNGHNLHYRLIDKQIGHLDISGMTDTVY